MRRAAEPDDFYLKFSLLVFFCKRIISSPCRRRPVAQAARTSSRGREQGTVLCNRTNKRLFLDEFGRSRQSHRTMKVHWFQHVPFEGLGALEGWLLARGHTLACTRFYAGDAPPSTPDGFDWLIVMGGPMNVYQHRDHSWLAPEKRLIRDAVAAGKRVLGVCLGAQLIADVLGGKVYQNGEREIGWFPVRAVPAGAGSPFEFPSETLVLHWHGDTFSPPPGSVWLAESAACAHQAFAVGPRVLGLQFHLEMNPVDVSRIAQACSEDFAPGPYVQSAGELIAHAGKNGAAAALLERFLTVLEQG
jgi:GMP synthase-like glutamine amidotransferase